MAGSAIIVNRKLPSLKSILIYFNRTVTISTAHSIVISISYITVLVDGVQEE